MDVSSSHNPYALQYVVYKFNFSYQWAANGLHKSTCGMDLSSRHRMAPSKYKNNAHNSIVGKQNPLSATYENRDKQWIKENPQLHTRPNEWNEFTALQQIWLIFKTKSSKFRKKQCGIHCVLPACQTYCTHTYVLARKKSQLTGIKNRHTKSDVIAMHTKSIVNACNERERKGSH